MACEFHQARDFLLEATVVALLIIELVFLFQGKSLERPVREPPVVY